MVHVLLPSNRFLSRTDNLRTHVGHTFTWPEVPDVLGVVDWNKYQKKKYAKMHTARALVRATQTLYITGILPITGDTRKQRIQFDWVIVLEEDAILWDIPHAF